jgi:small subunit ribosomal protein S1
MAIDKEKRRIRLSMKHITDDPRDTLAEKFPVGTSVTGVISRLLERGVFAEVDGGIEGLIPTSKLTTESIPAGPNSGPNPAFT